MDGVSVRRERILAGNGAAGILRLARDETLFKLATEGNERAFTAIYHRYHQPLYRYCVSLLGNSEDALDALQGTMMKALAAITGEQREIRLRPWLYRIAHNESLNLVRRRSSPDLAHPTEAEAADEQLIGRERFAELLGDLRVLPERQRSALVMRELNGLSYDEISEALKLSPAAARQAVHESRRAMYEMQEGRELPCEVVRGAISERDGRRLRSRRMRAHLADCGECEAFRFSIEERYTDLHSLASPLSPRIANALLDAILGRGGNGGGGIPAVMSRALTSKLGRLAAAISAVSAVAIGASELTPQAKNAEVADTLPGTPAPVTAATAATRHPASRFHGSRFWPERRARGAPRRATAVERRAGLERRGILGQVGSSRRGGTGAPLAKSAATAPTFVVKAPSHSVGPTASSAAAGPNPGALTPPGGGPTTIQLTPPRGPKGIAATAATPVSPGLSQVLGQILPGAAHHIVNP